MDLREIRFKKRISQYELQRDSGVEQSRISIIERGVLPAKFKEKARISAALGLAIDDIDWDGPMREGPLKEKRNAD